jgi:polar amino acid transport system permease protein
MAVIEGEVRHREKAPDVRGPTAPLPATTLGLGTASVGLILAGTFVLQILMAARGGVFTKACAELGFKQELEGSSSVCGIVESIQSSAQTTIIVLSILTGVVALALGFGYFRRMDSRRKREECITGAVLGLQGVGLSIALMFFRAGRPDFFANHFLNVADLQEYGGRFLNAAKNTMLLAFVGELGGIVIGLILAMLVISKRPAVRAPARTYINFFRGTPLIWQLSAGYFLIAFGLDIRINAFVVAMIVFSLNTGAYAAEVFRAGIQSIERGQVEASRSLGMSYMQAMRYAIVPQAVRRVIPPLMNEFVILIKDTSLVVVLGLLVEQYDLYSLARSGQAATFNSTFFTAAAIGYLAVTLPLIWLVNRVERRMRSGLVTTSEALR